jgi:hypothetical protein
MLKTGSARQYRETGPSDMAQACAIRAEIGQNLSLLLYLLNGR